jgi:hypothetical protein
MGLSRPEELAERWHPYVAPSETETNRWYTGISDAIYAPALTCRSGAGR